MTRLQRRSGAILTALAALTAVALIGAGMATASAPAPCPPGMTCISGKLMVRDPGSDTPHQLLVLDKNGAPMFWVDYGGAGSGGAAVCVFSLSLHPLACLGGPWGNYGGQAMVTLYAGGRPATLDYAQLAFLDGWLARRGVR